MIERDKGAITDTVIDGFLEFHFADPDEPLGESPALRSFVDWMADAEQDVPAITIEETLREIQTIRRMKEAAQRATSTDSSHAIPLATLLLEARIAARVDATQASQAMRLPEGIVDAVERSAMSVLEVPPYVLSRIGEALGLDIHRLRESLETQIGLKDEFFSARAFARTKSTDLAGDRARLEAQQALLNAEKGQRHDLDANETDQLKAKLQDVEELWTKV